MEYWISNSIVFPAQDVVPDGATNKRIIFLRLILMINTEDLKTSHFGEKSYCKQTRAGEQGIKLRSL
ncbi:hypothetical protein ACROYT_G000831 [Oculina patagonica]